jgi:hypothetical protein
MCNFDTMFKSPLAKSEFTTFFEQTCFMKNSCSIDIETMVTNMTYTQEEWEGISSEAYDPLLPWMVKTNKLSDLISEECYQRIYDLEVA